MPRRKIPLKAGEYYHLYNRGVNRQKIFFNRGNYAYFLRRVRKYLLEEDETSEVSKTSEVSAQESALPCEIVAYCLMPNHYHLLVKPGCDDLSYKMQLLGISYTKAINKQQHRVGALFQGQFKAVHVDRDDYLCHLSRYIHLNPVAAGLVKQPEDWEFSSYRDYLGLRSGTIPSPKIVLAQFDSRAAYKQFVDAYTVDEIDVIAHLLLED